MNLRRVKGADGSVWINGNSGETVASMIAKQIMPKLGLKHRDAVIEAIGNPIDDMLDKVANGEWSE